jgi:hypothetical protein
LGREAAAQQVEAERPGGRGVRQDQRFARVAGEDSLGEAFRFRAFLVGAGLVRGHQRHRQRRRQHRRQPGGAPPPGGGRQQQGDLVAGAGGGQQEERHQREPGPLRRQHPLQEDQAEGRRQDRRHQSPCPAESLTGRQRQGEQQRQQHHHRRPGLAAQEERLPQQPARQAEDHVEERPRLEVGIADQRLETRAQDRRQI